MPVATIANGHALELVTHRIRGGAGDGPTLGLIAGIHGDEPLGVETIRRFVAELDPASFSGELFVLPVANPYAFQGADPEHDARHEQPQPDLPRRRRTGC